MSDSEEVGQGEVVPAAGGSGTAVSVKRDDTALVQFLSAATDAAPIDPAQAQMDIIRQILSADSAEEVLRQTSAIHARDVLGDVLHILGYDFNESDLEGNNLGFYMLVNCVTDEGEPFKVTCGAVNVMAQLYRLNQLGVLPMDGRIVEAAKATKAGYKPMWLEAVAPAF